MAYYHIGRIEDPKTLIKKHKEFFKDRDFKGRIYISEQGINGQASGLSPHADEYMAWVGQSFQEMAFKVHMLDEHTFEKMTVKYRKELVSVRCEVDFSYRAEHVSPSQWKEMLKNRSEDTLLLDVRNHYESLIGHFEGAERPDVETFREFPEYIKKLKKARNPKETKVLMYCTGGIRCEFFSSMMKKEGFENVYQLEGGVINYGIEYGDEHWKGKLFVFDDRLAVPISDGAENPITCCSYCTTPNDTYVNCANMDCNALFLTCRSCLEAHRGCCSEECGAASRVRPFVSDGKPFRKWSHEEKLALQGGTFCR